MLNFIKNNKEVIIKRGIIVIGAAIGLVLVGRSIFSREETWEDEPDYEVVDEDYVQ